MKAPVENSSVKAPPERQVPIKITNNVLHTVSIGQEPYVEVKSKTDNISVIDVLQVTRRRTTHYSGIKDWGLSEYIVERNSKRSLATFSELIATTGWLSRRA
jgi:hypothetical protein